MTRDPSTEHVVIAMPAYRAVRTLEKTVRAIPAGVADELLLVDDASQDGTAALARELGLRVYVHTSNRGYGGNQKTCYTQALRHGASIIVMLHPDYQYDPNAVPLLIAPILAGDADVTFGSRFAGLGDPLGGGMPVYRYLGNRLTTVLENLMLGARFTETHSGMRAYTREALLSLPFLEYSNDFVFDSQLLVDSITSGLRVVEVPIPTRYTKESSSIGIGSSIRYVWASLLYCGRRALERGRRGARSPTARWRRRERSTERQTTKSPAPRLERLARQLEDEESANPAFWTILPTEARGYAVRGLRMFVLDDRSETADQQEVSDIVVCALEGDGPSDRQLSRISGSLDEEGLLVLRIPRRTDASTVRRLGEKLAPRLAAAGLRLVETRGSSTRGPRRDAVVLARPR